MEEFLHSISHSRKRTETISEAASCHVDLSSRRDVIVFINLFQRQSLGCIARGGRRRRVSRGTRVWSSAAVGDGDIPGFLLVMIGIIFCRCRQRQKRCLNTR